MDPENLVFQRREYAEKLFTAELQFRLASAVRIAVTSGSQPLDLPTEWVHGRHNVKHEELALRQDQASYAASFLHRTATFMMAVAIKDAIRSVVESPKNSADTETRNAYQIARLIRNAFVHGPFRRSGRLTPIVGINLSQFSM